MRAGSTAEPLLEVARLSKTFPGQRALDDVALRIHAGEIYGLIGHNGSGKSTLIKVLAGYHSADPGERILVRGAPYDIGTARHGLAFIHQDLGLVESLNTVDNLALGRGYQTRRGRIDWRTQRRLAAQSIAAFGGAFDIDVPVRAISPGDRTIVAIARAFRDTEPAGRVLVLDEPTAALHAEEVEKLFTAVRAFAEQGGGAMFVSHRLREVLSLADRVGVLREGRLVAEHDTARLDEATLAEAMIGRALENVGLTPPPVREDVVLRVRNLGGARIEALDLDVHGREIVGVTGLHGSGREEIGSLLFGAAPRVAGDVELHGRSVPAGSPAAAIDAGMAYVPADRGHAVTGAHSVRENMTIARLSTVAPRGRIRQRAERREVAGWIERLGVMPSDPERPAGTLSGGNQQKVVLARWLRTEPKVLILDEPTNGVDVGAKAAVHQIILGAARNGTAALVCSTDADELETLCDRVLVMRDGRIAAQLHGGAVTERRIVAEALGASPQSPVVSGP
jgi:ribose transport system ATP-binding protein